MYPVLLNFIYLNDEARYTKHPILYVMFFIFDIIINILASTLYLSFLLSPLCLTYGNISESQT